MDKVMNRIVLGAGSLCGLLIGTGNTLEGLTLGLAALFGIVMLRTARQELDGLE